MTITTFRKVFVDNMKDWDENKASGFVYLTEGQEKPTSDEYMDMYLHIRKVTKDDHPSWGNKKFNLAIERSEYQSDQLIDLENILFEWANGEYHQGTYKIVEIKQ